MLNLWHLVVSCFLKDWAVLNGKLLRTTESKLISGRHADIRKLGWRHNDLHDVLKFVHVQDLVAILVKERKDELHFLPCHLLAHDLHQEVAELGLGQRSLLLVEPQELDGVDVLKKVFQNGVIFGLPGIGNLWKSAQEKEYDEDGAEDQERRDEEERVLVLLNAGVQVHAEDGADAGAEGDAEHAHLHEQVHPDDPIASLVLKVFLFINAPFTIWEMAADAIWSSVLTGSMNSENNKKIETYIRDFLRQIVFVCFWQYFCAWKYFSLASYSSYPFSHQNKLNYW